MTTTTRLHHRLDATTEHVYTLAADAPLDRAALAALLLNTDANTDTRHRWDTPYLDHALPTVVETGYHLHFESPWSSQVRTVLAACGHPHVRRVERTVRRQYATVAEAEAARGRIDPMLETVFEAPIASFGEAVNPGGNTGILTTLVPLATLAAVNRDKGLAMDAADLAFYTRLFERLGRDPTLVELFDLAQSNSEHSRHWVFQGTLVDPDAPPSAPPRPSLFADVKSTLVAAKAAGSDHSRIAFADNASAVRGGPVARFAPSPTTRVYGLVERTYHPTLTAETHNFPTGIAPFPGAATGIGGRLRDNQCIGRGGHVVAGTAGYAVGPLVLDEAAVAGEVDQAAAHAAALTRYGEVDQAAAHAAALTRYGVPAPTIPAATLLVEASNGASDYGNKFGEPIVCGYTRTFGWLDETVSSPSFHWEWRKPIMFTAGVGMVDDAHLRKRDPASGMAIVRVGGPAYRIGVGGGAASSRAADAAHADLDRSAVQRGDPQMGNKLNRVIRACIELDEANPIESLHDQGAGGMANVTKEICAPVGARVDLSKVVCGDATMDALELWTAEYQECNTMLVRPDACATVEAVCAREKLPCATVGTLTGDGRIVVDAGVEGQPPVVDLDLADVLGSMPAKTYTLEAAAPPVSASTVVHPPVTAVHPSRHLPPLRDQLTQVLRLATVGSKRFLTNKVDRSVGGLVVQQQCVGAYQVPLADYALVAHSAFGTTGTVTAIGEQPLKGLADVAAMARLSVTEMLTNLMWVGVESLAAVRASANWMWAVHEPGQLRALATACGAMCDWVKALGFAVDGGKDSLSMVSKVKRQQQAGEGDPVPHAVRGPGTLVFSGYAYCPDIHRRITPEFKRPGNPVYLVDLSDGTGGLGGSAWAQAVTHNAAMATEPVTDVADACTVRAAFDLVQTALRHGWLRAGHDRSDGGLVVTLLEMLFAADHPMGVEATVPRVGGEDEAGVTDAAAVGALFHEGPGVVVEVDAAHEAAWVEAAAAARVPLHRLGTTTATGRCVLRVASATPSPPVLDVAVADACAAWETTSYRLERRQCDPRCVDAEWAHATTQREATPFRHVTSDVARWRASDAATLPLATTPLRTGHRVAVLRTEGSNGDREMAAALYHAGHTVLDLTMDDVADAAADPLADVRAVVFVGGFSHADVLGAGAGWCAHIKHHATLRARLMGCLGQPHVRSLGVCNGCQVMVCLGLLGPDVSLATNASGRFESRFTTVGVSATAPGPWLQGLRGCGGLGVWSAHKEGRFVVGPTATCVPALRYVGPDGRAATHYPYNPNGSDGALAGVCSADGRHLAMMPHPERSYLGWQCPEGEAAKWRRYTAWARLFAAPFYNGH